MPDRICALFCVPPIAFARLGGSTAPLEAYRWAQPKNPRADGETVITPAWSFRILTDGSVQPYKPNSIQFRDGNLIRPVAPFIEVWAKTGSPAADPATWHSQPLTPALLAAEGASEAALSFTIAARNLKASRRTGTAELAFGTFPEVAVPGDDHSVHPLSGVNPPGTANPMIPLGRDIPLGSFQVLRPVTQPAAGTTPWPADIRLDAIRARYTPATGLFFGPPVAATPTNADPAPAVQPAQAFLNPDAGWFGSDGQAGGRVIPGDTFDETARGSAMALGVVDDTCEARIDIAFVRADGSTLETHSNLFVGPPDFGPDRRPFVSVADELNDRAADAQARTAAMSDAELHLWVADLFERVYEVVSLFNIDRARTENGAALTPAMLAPAALVGDGLAAPARSMGSRDALRNPLLRVSIASPANPLPLSHHARERHRSLSDVDALISFVSENPDRLKALVRGPFETQQLADTERERLRQTTMRMPPFMAQSTPATPLTLAAWQYEALMRWAALDTAPSPAGAAPALESVAQSPASQARVKILQRLDTAGLER